MIISLIVLVILFIIFLYGITQFNKLRRLNLLCTGSFADIDTLLTKRADLVPNLVSTVSGAAGFEKSFNIAGGFEGDVDGEGHRGNTSGWKASGLPWQQG